MMKSMHFIKLIFFVFSAILLNSCFTSRNVYVEPVSRVWPNPPDTARIQYLMSFSNSAEITGDQSWFSRIVFGVKQSIAINKPFGVAVNNSKLYICDQNKIHVVDLAKRTFNIFAPEDLGKIAFTTNCAFGENGNFYVADATNNKVLIYDAEGKYLTSIGNSENFKPMDVAVSDHKIFICDSELHKVSVYEEGSNKFLYHIPDTAKVGSFEHLYTALNISVIGTRLYVSDMGNYRVKIYNIPDGKYISSFGGNGKNPGNLARNKGIAVDKDTNVYVVDAAFDNIQIFNKNNELLMFFGEPYSKKGDMYLPASVTIDYNNIKYFDKYIDPSFDAKYLIYVTNQFGPDKVSVYAMVEQTKAAPEEIAKKKKKIKKIKIKGSKSKGKSLL